MYVLYDGSFNGLLTVIFSKYKNIEDLYGLNSLNGELNFLHTGEIIKTDLQKSQRVLRAIKKDFSQRFYTDIVYCFNSKFVQKDLIIAKTIKLLYKHGESYVNSANREIIEFRNIVKNVSSERHAYLGLLRFSEIKGGYLFAEFEPHNNILPIIMGHFARRLSSENFAIYDTNRKIVGVHEDEKSEIFSMEESEFTLKEEELEYRKLWKNFYNSIAIESRKNPKLKISNMPKKYWKYLPEID